MEQAAKAGSWIVVSTVRFPQFWKRMCDRLTELSLAGEVDDNFRLLFDLQGFTQNDISDSFLFDHCLPFHLTEQNMEEFEGFEDVWSAILDERVLIKLEEKVTAMKDLMLEEEAKAAADDGKSETQHEVLSKDQKPAVEPESPSNFKLVDGIIKSPAQKHLYK